MRTATLLEDAMEFYHYHPIQTPKEALTKALLEVRRWEMEAVSEYNVLSSLQDDTIYETGCTDQIIQVQPRTISSQTEDTITLNALPGEDEEPVLSRNALESGERVSTDDAWYSPQFAFGFAIRNQLTRQVISAKQMLDRAELEVVRIKAAIRNGDVILTPDEIDDIRFLRELEEVSCQLHSPAPPVNWSREGF